MRVQNDLKYNLLLLLQRNAKGEENNMTVKQLSEAAKSMGLDHVIGFTEMVAKALDDLYTEGKIKKTVDSVHGTKRYFYEDEEEL